MQIDQTLLYTFYIHVYERNGFFSRLAARRDSFKLFFEFLFLPSKGEREITRQKRDDRELYANSSRPDKDTVRSLGPFALADATTMAHRELDSSVRR